MRAAISRVSSTRTSAALMLLILVFVGTRAYTTYRAVTWPGQTDVEEAYRPWAVAIVDRGSRPYVDTSIEYPPGALPFIITPRIAGPDITSYRTGFVFSMLIVDTIGLGGVLLLAKRRRSMLGPWLWVLVLPITGPLLYLRFDLVPAVATLWMVERADKNKWLAAGALLGFAIAVKAYPLILLPLAFFLCPRETRSRLLTGVGLAIALTFLPFITVLPDVFSSVVAYHTQRGVQIESLWGSILYIVRSNDYFRAILPNYGAHHFVGGYVWLLKILATLATVSVVVLGAWVARRSPKVPRAFADVAFATILAAVAVASVFSPQFIFWVVALGAAAMCYPDSRTTGPALMLVVISVLTRIIFPNLHGELIRAEPFPVIVLWCRNVAVVATAAIAFRQIGGLSAPSTPVPVSAGTP